MSSMFKKDWRQAMVTKKCPRCYQDIPAENRFCTQCGQDLSAPASGTEQQAVPAAYREQRWPAEAAPAPAYTQAASAPVRQTGYCPNGHDVDDPSLGFCVICGSPLVDEPVSRRR